MRKMGLVFQTLPDGDRSSHYTVREQAPHNFVSLLPACPSLTRIYVVVVVVVAFLS